jgi:Asp-tRNA(Asn)/Glu-tRNA(Gln) amidotransferase A subunit family amidase
MSELLKASAGELAAKIRGKQISSRELVEACLARYEARHSAINAIVDLAADEALAAADAADRAIAQGAARPLLGVPLTIKSSIDVAGRLCECGSNFRRGGACGPTRCWLYACGGRVVILATNTPDMLMAYETDNHLHGRTNHPLNRPSLRGSSGEGGGDCRWHVAGGWAAMAGPIRAGALAGFSG